MPELLRFLITYGAIPFAAASATTGCIAVVLGLRWFVNHTHTRKTP